MTGLGNPYGHLAAQLAHSDPVDVLDGLTDRELGPGGTRLVRKIALQHDPIIAATARRFINGDIPEQEPHTAYTTPFYDGTPDRPWPRFPRIPRHHGA